MTAGLQQKEARTLCSDLFLSSTSCFQLLFQAYREGEKHGRPLSPIQAALAASQFNNSDGLCQFPCDIYLSVPLDTPLVKGGESGGADRMPLLATVSNDNLQPTLFHTPSLACRHGRHAGEAI